MKLEMLIDELQEILDNSFKMPLSGASHEHSSGGASG